MRSNKQEEPVPIKPKHRFVSKPVNKQQTGYVTCALTLPPSRESSRVREFTILNKTDVIPMAMKDAPKLEATKPAQQVRTSNFMCEAMQSEVRSPCTIRHIDLTADDEEEDRGNSKAPVPSPSDATLPEKKMFQAQQSLSQFLTPSTQGSTYRRASALKSLVSRSQANFQNSTSKGEEPLGREDMPEMESPKVTVIKRSESQMRFFDMCVDHYLNKNDWLEFDNSSALGSNKEVEVEKQLEEYRRRRGQSPTKRLIGKVQFMLIL